MKGNLHKKYTKKALTMAEVLLVMLLTATIMGLLARVIVRVDPDKNKVLFIKTYHAMEEIIASSINDPTKYDQNRYTKKQIEEWVGDKHFDLANSPLDTAYVSYISSGAKKTACKANCDNGLNQSNALCYYVAEHINTIGDVKCKSDNTTSPNLRSSLGVCYWNLNASALTGSDSFDIVIDPSCKRTSSTKEGYAIKIFANGAMTVPVTSSLTESKNQSKAVAWAKSPTTHD